MANNNTEENITEEEIKLLKPKNDIVFQSLFNKNNKKITKAFVQALLEENIERLIINEDKELLRERPEDKLGILDLELDINEDEKVDVEIQLIDKKNFIERLLFYFSKLYQSQIKRGSNYLEAKRVVLIAIIDYPFELTEKIKEMETVWKLFEEKHKNLVLTNYLEIHILELEKVKNTYLKNKDDKKAQWMLFLDDPNSKEVQDIMKKNEEIQEATIEVRKMSQDEKMQRLADLREKAIMDEKAIYAGGLEKGIKQGIKKGIKQGLNRGVKQGKQERTAEIIKKLYDMNTPLNKIAEIVELEEEKVKEILNLE